MPESSKTMSDKIINKGGRKKKELDFNIFEELCKILCTQSEICNVMDVDHKTLNLRVAEHYGEDFPTTYKRLTDSGRMSLRRAQMRSALAGNNVMLIWLGKQYLGQTEKMEVASQEYINQEIQIIDNPNGHKEEVENRVKAFLR